MSEEGSFWLSSAERLFGLLVFIMGLIATFYTLTSLDSLKLFVGFFTFLGIILLILGFLMMTAKTEE